MNKCQYCKRYTSGDNLICDECRDDWDEEDSSLSVDVDLWDEFVTNYSPIDENKSVLDQGLPTRMIGKPNDKRSVARDDE